MTAKLRPRTCNGCRAFIISSVKTCELNYPQTKTGVAYAPTEYCPKPRTNADLSSILRSRTK